MTAWDVGAAPASRARCWTSNATERKVIGMRRSALGRKALTVLVSTSMVVSMMPTAALADAVGVADASTTEQSQVKESGSGGG